ncbi:hypothetical protein ACFPRL_19545 [Pseudoclavibacter helvolus]
MFSARALRREPQLRAHGPLPPGQVAARRTAKVEGCDKSGTEGNGRGALEHRECERLDQLVEVTIRELAPRLEVAEHSAEIGARRGEHVECRLEVLIEDERGPVPHRSGVDRHGAAPLHR